mmetsp:Transcript_25037/g.67559  ORF Transcript_25037/g.67559 Transcript_25037/m.67559 type:complete len:201 (+) Transcript_25037:797-1399(+)
MFESARDAPHLSRLRQHVGAQGRHQLRHGPDRQPSLLVHARDGQANVPVRHEPPRFREHLHPRSGRRVVVGDQEAPVVNSALVGAAFDSDKAEVPLSLVRRGGTEPNTCIRGGLVAPLGRIARVQGGVESGAGLHALPVLGGEPVGTASVRARMTGAAANRNPREDRQEPQHAMAPGAPSQVDNVGSHGPCRRAAASSGW